MSEKLLQVINDGRMAQLAASHIGTLIDEFKTKKLAELSQNFRAGKIDQATLLASVSAFCVLEDLERDMKRKILKAETASNDLHKEQLK